MRICIYHPTMGDIIGSAIAKAHPDADIRIVHDISSDPPDRDEIEILIANKFPAGLLQRCPQLQWLHLTGTGIDHVLLGKPKVDLIVTNSVNVPARAVAEFAWMGLLALAKEGFRLSQQQRQHIWHLPDAQLVAGSHMVLVGLGHVGAEIARRATAFDVRVTAITQRGLASPLVERVLPPVGLIDVVGQADYLILAAPATPATFHLVDEAVIRALPATAVLINVGRSSLLDMDALVHVLQEDQLRGALLDVHDEEPLPTASPLWDVKNLWITPHAAYRFPGEEREVAQLFVSNLASFIGKKDLHNRVDIGTLLLNAAKGV